MGEKIIRTKNGLYGRFVIALPLYTKNVMLDWANKAGWKKAEFLRTVLTIGFLVLAKAIEVPDQEAGEAAGRRPTTGDEDGGDRRHPLY